MELLDRLDGPVRDKIIYNMTKTRYLNEKKLFKKLTGNIWEFRTLFKKSHYRFFAFWEDLKDSRPVVIVTHGIIKKTDKTPKSDIIKAEEIRKRFLVD